MKKYIIVLLLIQFFIQPCFAEKFQRFNAFINKGKVFVGNIVDGAHETWDDLKEVYDEVSSTISEKTKKEYEKVVDKLNLKKYVIRQIGQAEVTLFQIGRNLNVEDRLSCKVTAWLTEYAQKGRVLTQEDINEYITLIDSNVHKKIAYEMIENVHNADTFKELVNHDNDEFKRTQLDFLFALYANPILHHYKDNLSDAYSGVAYAKAFLKIELGLD